MVPTPMPNLQSTIQQLAAQFADGVLSAIRGASLEDILAETSGGAARPRGRVTAAKRGPGRPRGGRSGGRGRRSAADLNAVVDRIVALVGKHKAGLRAEQIKAQLGIPRNQLMRPLSMALKKGLRKKGQKRATTYFAK